MQSSIMMNKTTASTGAPRPPNIWGGGVFRRLAVGVLCASAVLWGSLIAAAEPATTTLRNWYGEGMVFQRGKPFAVMGSAPAGTDVTVAIGSNSANAVADSTGAFKVEIAALPASLSPYKLTVSVGGKTVRTINEVYSGDLVLVTGQSNMEANYVEYYTGSGANGNYAGKYGPDDLPTLVEDAAIRFIKVDHVWDDDNVWRDLPLRHVTNAWLRASASVRSDGTTPDNQHFSYLAQYAAQRMRTVNPNVPVGIIDASWGGMPIKDFVSGGLVNTHILPLVGLNVGGILFYQGESNTAQNLYPWLMIDFYTNLSGKDFPSMINSFRDKFGENVPIVWAQIARSDHSNWFFSPVRAAQVKMLSSPSINNLNNLACVSILDTDKGTAESMHPLGKDIIGPRMADCLLSILAGNGPKTGPTPVRASANGNTVTVEFSNATGLKTMKPVYTTAATATHYADDTTGADVCEVEIAGTDGVFWPAAQARISGETLVATASDRLVGAPTQIRYGWQNAPVNPNLYNGDGLPAPTFVMDVEGAEVNPKPCNILFNSLGSAPCIAPISGNAGATAVLPSAKPYPKLKKEFVEWNTSQTGTGTSYKGGATVTIPNSNKTIFYAIYRAADSDNSGGSGESGGSESGESGGSGDSGSGETGGSGESGGSEPGESGGSGGSGSVENPSLPEESVGEAGWFYTPYAKPDAYKVIGTITDGQWTLEVTKFDRENGSLEFASSKSLIKDWSAPADSALSGVLDLRRPLVVADGDGVRTAIRSVVAGRSAFSGSDKLVAFYCDILAFSADATSAFQGNANLTTVGIGGNAEVLPTLLFNQNSKLKAVAFDFPNLRTIENRVFGISNPDPIDVQTFAIPSVESVLGAASQGGSSFLYGDLFLTNVETIGDGAFNNASLTNVYLAGQATRLGNNAFRGSTITNVVLNLSQLSEVSSSAFSGQKNIRRVELVRKLADMGQVTNVIAAAASGNTNLGDNGYYVPGKWLPNDLRIYVSKPQWTPSAAETYSAENPTGFFLGADTFTDKEKQMIAADPTLTGAFGVCVRVVNGTLKRRAFFVHKNSPYDKIGLICIR